MEIRNEDASVVAAFPADDLSSGYGVHPTKLGTGGQAAIDPPAFQKGVIGVGQTRPNEVCTLSFDRLSALLAAYICERAESIFVFSLRVLVVYTSV